MTVSARTTALIIGAVVAFAAASSLADSDPTKDVLAVFDRGATAWNAGDLDGYLATFANDARWVSGGRVVRGKQAMAKIYRARFDTPEKMGTLTSDKMEVELLGSANALVFAEWHHKAGEVERQGVFTVHVRLVDGAWVIVSDHNSVSPSQE